MGCLLSHFHFGSYTVKESDDSPSAPTSTHLHSRSHGQHHVEPQRIAKRQDDTRLPDDRRHDERRHDDRRQPVQRQLNVQPDEPRRIKKDKSTQQQPVIYTTTFETQVDAAPPPPPPPPKPPKAQQESFDDSEMIEIDTNLYTPEVEEAIVKIQAGIRGYLTRKSLKGKQTNGDVVPQEIHQGIDHQEFEDEKSRFIPPPSSFQDTRIQQQFDVRMSTSAPGQSFQDGRGFREQVLVAPNRANRLQEKVDEQLKLDEEIRKKEEELRRTEEEIRRIEELQMNHNLLSQELTSQGLVQQEMMPQGFMTQDLMSSGLVMGQPNGQSQVTMSLVEQIYQNYESPAIQIESNGYVLDENEAAIKIQAAYRGYHIRKTLSRDASPSPSPTSPRYQYDQDTFFNQESNAKLGDGFFQIEQQEVKQQTEMKQEKELQGIQLTETHKETESQNDKAEVKQIDNQENKVIEGPKAETKQESKQEEPRQQEVKQQEQPKQDEPKKQERQKPNEIVRFQILPGDITFRTQTSVDIATPPFVSDEQFTFEQPQEVVNQEKVEVANEIIEVISSSRKLSKDDVKDEQEVIIDKVQQEKEDDKEQEADEEQEEAVLSSEGKEHDEKDFRRRNKKSKKQRQREKRREEAEKQAAAAASQKDHVKSVQEPKVDVKPKDEGPKVIDVIIKESENKIEEIKSEEAKTEIKTEETRIQIPDFEVPKAEVSNESQIKEAQEKSNDKTDISNEGITTNKNVELEITKILSEAIKEQTQQGQITTDPSVILLDLKEQILKDEQQQELQHQIQQQEVKREQELQKPIECQDADTLITLQTNEGLIQLQVDQPTQLQAAQAAQAAQAVSQLQSNAFQSTESPIKLQENFHLQMQETEVQNKVKEPQEFQAAPSQAPESQETLASEIHTPQTLGTLASQASESLTPQIPETQVQQALDFQAPQVPVSQAPVFQVSEFQAPQATGSKQETQVLTSDPKSNLQLDLESPFICDVISPNIIQSPSSPDDGQGDDADAEADEPITGLFTTMPVRASSPNPFGRKKRKGKKGSKR